MAKKDIDWSNLGFGYVKTDKRFVANYKNGAWDNGVITDRFRHRSRNGAGNGTAR